MAVRLGRLSATGIDPEEHVEGAEAVKRLLGCIQPLWAVGGVPEKEPFASVGGQQVLQVASRII